MTFIFKPDVLELLHPITIDSEKKLTTVTLNAITYSDHAKIVNVEKIDETAAFKSLVKISSGLSDSDINKLKMPDWNTIRLKISDLVSKGSDFFFKQAGQEFDADNPRLLVPFEGDNGLLIDVIELQVPSVASTDLMQKQKTDTDKSLFITMECTGLSRSEINKLSVPDWNFLQGRINSFLNEPAEYFR